jgi:Bacterial Ig-like domain (group 3)/FG-GAP-like repeat
LRLLALSAVPALASTPQFKPRQDINTNFQHLTGLAVGDFNGDGKPDIAVTDDVSKQVVVYLNSGNGSFSSPITTTIQMGALGAGAIVAGDFNEDRKLDLIVGTIAGSQANIFLSGNGDGTFTQGQTLPGSFGFFGAAVADINHDSHLDLIAGGNGTLYVYLGDGHGNFTPQSFTNQGPSDAFFSVVAGDFNNDSKIDFVATAFNSNNLRYFAGNGDGSFAAPSVLTSHFSNPRFLASADFNGDGKRDLLLGLPDIASIILGNGDGTFQLNNNLFLPTPLPINPLPTTAGAPVVAAADMDGDGKIDAVAADSASNTMNVFLNDGSGKFPQTTPDFTTSVPAAYNQLQIADLNGDGLPDIIATNYITQNISVFLSIRQPTKPTITLTGGASQSLAGTPQLSFSVQVTGVQSLTATGSVTLLDGTTSLGQQTLNTSGQATFSVANPATGQHNFSVSYTGDSNYLAATSNVLADSVTDFQLSLPSSAQTVTHGATATYNLSLTPVAGFAGNVSFVCSGLPSGASCVSNTASINGQPATIALNVITTSASNIHAGIRRSNVVETAALSIASFFLTILLPRRRELPKLVLVLFTAIGLGLSVGCSGGSNGSTNTNNPTPVTTAFTITGSATQSGQTVSHQVSASITID